jgi:hypothetical protein
MKQSYVVHPMNPKQGVNYVRQSDEGCRQADMTEFAVKKQLKVPAIRLSDILRAPALLGLAAVALGAALQVNYGQYHPISLQLLTISLGAAGLAVFKCQDRSVVKPKVDDDPVLRRLLFVGVSFQFALLLLASPTAQPMAASDFWVFRGGIIVAAGVSAFAFSPLSLRERVRVRGNCERRSLNRRRLDVAPHPGSTELAEVSPLPAGERANARRDRARLRGRALWLLLPVTHFLLGLWVLRCVPPPPVDICVFQQDACRALLHGINPYSIDFPNLYANPSKMYDASLVANGRLLFAFPYPPLSLLLILPGYLAGDFRLAHLAAMSLAGAMIMFAEPGLATMRRSRKSAALPPLPEGEGKGGAAHSVAALAGVLFLFTPRAFFIVEAGFTEPLVVLLLTAVVVAARRRWRCLPFLFGLFLASKQYLLLAAPLGMLLFSDEVGATPIPLSQRLKPWLIAAATAGIVTLPLALWNLPAFMKSVAFLQFHQPMRADSLSYLPNLIGYTGWRPLLALPFVLAIGLIVIFLRRLPKTPSAFAAGFAFVFLVFFAINKQAFCGYYLAVIAALCLSVAASRDREALPI